MTLIEFFEITVTNYHIFAPQFHEIMNIEVLNPTLNFSIYQPDSFSISPYENLFDTPINSPPSFKLSDFDKLINYLKYLLQLLLLILDWIKPWKKDKDVNKDEKQKQKEKTSMGDDGDGDGDGNENKKEHDNWENNTKILFLLLFLAFILMFLLSLASKTNNYKLYRKILSFFDRVLNWISLIGLLNRQPTDFLQQILSKFRNYIDINKSIYLNVVSILDQWGYDYNEAEYMIILLNLVKEKGLASNPLDIANKFIVISNIKKKKINKKYSKNINKY